MRPVPVLMYHHVNTNKGDMVSVMPDVFEGQMRYLHEAGYKTLKIDELISYIRGDLILKEKAAVVTFDDGWLDNYTYAFPALKKYKINAGIFIVTDWVDNASKNSVQTPDSAPTHRESKLLIENGSEHKVMLNWELVKEMSGSGLVEFYSHTKTHVNCALLTEDELSEELRGSRQTIEKRLGKTCPYLCWPRGNYNNTALKVARDIGYKALFTVKHGVVRAGHDPFAIKRIVVKDNVAWFKKRMLIYSNNILSKLYLKTRKKEITQI